MEAVANLKYLRISPRKVKIVLDLIRGKDVGTATAILLQTPKAASEPVLKLLKKSVVDKRTALIFALVLLGSILLNISPVWFVLLAALSGVALKALEGRKAE